MAKWLAACAFFSQLIFSFEIKQENNLVEICNKGHFKEKIGGFRFKLDANELPDLQNIDYEVSGKFTKSSFLKSSIV